MTLLMVFQEYCHECKQKTFHQSDGIKIMCRTCHTTQDDTFEYEGEE